MKAAEEKMKKAEKVTQAGKRVSNKEAKAKANKMFMTKSKDTSQKGIQKAAKAIEQRVEQLEEIEAPKSENIIRFGQPQSLQLHNKFPIMANRLTLKAGDKRLLHKASFQFPLGRTIAITGINGSGKQHYSIIFYKGVKGLRSPRRLFLEPINRWLTNLRTIKSYWTI